MLLTVKSRRDAASLKLIAGSVIILKPRWPLPVFCSLLGKLKSYSAVGVFSFRTPKNFPAPEGVVWHLLLPISKGWGAGTDSRFDVKTLKERIDIINAEGGAVTFDTPVASDGTIPGGVLRVLQELGKDIQKLKDGARSF